MEKCCDNCMFYDTCEIYTRENICDKWEGDKWFSILYAKEWNEEKQEVL